MIFKNGQILSLTSKSTKIPESKVTKIPGPKIKKLFSFTSFPFNISLLKAIFTFYLLKSGISNSSEFHLI